MKLADIADRLDPANAATLKPEKNERYERGHATPLAARLVSAFQIIGGSH